MGRKKKNSYNRTVFAERIEELQLSRGYSSEYVLEHLKDDNGIPLINDRQVLDSYLSGKRKPRDFDVALKAFANFYDVTTDYLLGLDDTPNPQIKSVQDFTGLSDDAIRRLMELKDTYPDILAMVDAILTGTTAEDITLFLNLYKQIYDDYQDSKQGVRDSAYDMMKMQNRFFHTQCFYNYLKSAVIAKLASHFDDKMVEDEDSRQYDQLQDTPEATTQAVTVAPDDSSKE